MNYSAPRSIEEYLKQLRAALEGEDPALIQDALYDAEEYLRAEVAAHPGKSEADVLELIASTYGAPEEVAAAYRDTEVKVKAALQTPAPRRTTSEAGAARKFFGIFLDPRAYTSLFYMLLTLATGIVYFTLVVVGISLSAGLSILIIGIPFFLAFIGITRVISLGEGRLIEAITGERMPRRPVHPGPATGWWARIGAMLSDARTWTTLLYLVLMLPLGIIYFVIAAVGLSIGVNLAAAPIAVLAEAAGWLSTGQSGLPFAFGPLELSLTSHSWILSLVLLAIGILVLTLLMHLARGIGRAHARLAKALLVEA
ncbi:MAG TPA: sensor domain-containing protein [Steroidobacteraceae bacterium]|nr:sensor domain-containing protein [Steroidobacteraceae bacterium]